MIKPHGSVHRDGVAFSVNNVGSSLSDLLPVGLVSKQSPPEQNTCESGPAAAHSHLLETSLLLGPACEKLAHSRTWENVAGSVFTFFQFLQDESRMCLCKILGLREPTLGETVQKQQSLHCHPPKLQSITALSTSSCKNPQRAFSLEW